MVFSFSIVPIPSSNEEIRLVDDAFGKICHMVSDGSWVVRVQAAKLLVSYTFFSEHVACYACTNTLRTTDRDRYNPLLETLVFLKIKRNGPLSYGEAVF